jgi:DNA polymerase elongation subunit (family B)
MLKSEFFTYDWSIDESEEQVTSIRIYGINDNKENVCVRVNDFTPYVYIELPDENITWDNSKASILSRKLDYVMGNRRPIKKVLAYKKKLYGADINVDGTRKTHPYLMCSFSNKKDIKILLYKLKNMINVPGLGNVQLRVHESDADPILQLTCYQKISMAGWVQFKGKIVNDDDKITLCDKEYIVNWKHLSPLKSDVNPKPKILCFDIEVNSSNPSVMPDSSKSEDKIFQISCVFFRPGDKPEEYEQYLLSLGDPDPEIVGAHTSVITFKTEYELLEGYTNLIRTENPNLIAGYNILCFDIPYMIERAKYKRCMYEFDKQGFPKYAHAKEETIKWKSSAYGTQEFQFLHAEGRVFIDLLPLIKRDFKMNNYKLKTIADYFLGETKDPLNAKGIFKCYREGMKKTKDTNCYTKKAQKMMGIVGKYCMVDSILIAKLMTCTQTWIGLVEMASTCCVSIFTLYTQGQQIKVFSKLYKYCMYENIVVEKDVYKVQDNEKYIGAHVFDPIVGRHKKVVPFDFASLYPTTIIAYNIDYHTWVKDDSGIPDSLCHVMDWQDHVGCIHDPKIIRMNELTNFINNEEEKIKKLRKVRDSMIVKKFITNNISKAEAVKMQQQSKDDTKKQINKLIRELKPYKTERSDLQKSKPKFPMCEKRFYRFLKEPKGVVPTIIQNLLDARKHTRKVDIVKCYDEIKILKQTDSPENKIKIDELNGLIDVLTKRQLAYKVSANSMYGAMGVRRGYLPFMPGAMCTTYMGRTNIEIVAKTITDKYRGQLIYGDTDSTYIVFPHLTLPQEIWDYALYVAEQVTKLFPSPIELEFEEAIYDFFFILSKKRYMYLECKRDGVVSDKIGKKGVLLARRDNSSFVRDIYEDIIMKISRNEDMENVYYYIFQQIQKLFSNSFPVENFVVTKSVGDCGDLEPEIFVNEKGLTKGKTGDYTVTMLPSNNDEKIEEMITKNAIDEKMYYRLQLPAQVQLAEKMRQRGQRVDVGTRLEYIIIDQNRHTENQSTKIESLEYFKRHNTIHIDHLYYLKALATPLDQMLNAAYYNKKGFQKDLLLTQYNRCFKIKEKLMSELKNLFRPNITLEENNI